MFKRILKILGIALGGVMGGLVLIVGIAFVAGAFNEKIVEPGNIAFAQTDTITTSTALDLRVNTSTEGVNRKTLTLSAEPAGIVKLPETATIGQDFIVWPVKDAEGNNIGGAVKITASYNGMLFTSCNVFIDVPIKTLTVSTEFASLSKGDSITFSATVYPERALNPGKLDQGLSAFDREKTIYYMLYGEDGNLLDTSFASFKNGVVDKGNVISSKEVNQTTTITTKKECNFYLKAYAYDTFRQEDKYSGLTIENQISKMVGGVSESQDEKGQMIVVADVYIDDMQATNDDINTYWYEKYSLVARKDGKPVEGFDLNIKLIPKSDSSGYDYTSLDYLMDNITIEWVDGAEVSVTKDAEHFKGTDPSAWTWTIVPLAYSDVDTTSTLKASITYRKQDGSTDTAEWNFKVNLLTRPISGITVDYNGESQIELNADSETENFIELEKDMVTTNTDGFIKNTYKYFTVNPGVGQPHSTFSLLKFYLPRDLTSTRPTKGAGTLYKFSFEINIEGSEQQFSINFEDAGSLQGSNTLTYYEWDSDKGAFKDTPVPEGTGRAYTGRYRVEGIYAKNDTTPAGIIFQNATGSKTYPISNLKYYEQEDDSFSIYPYVEVDGVRVYTELNTDTLQITSNLSKIIVGGYGAFDLSMAVLVTGPEGNPIVDENGNFVAYSRSTVRVTVTNSVKDLSLSITDHEGKNNGITGSFDTSDLKLDENGRYYISIKAGPNTNFDVLKQAYESGALKVNVRVVNTQYVDSLGLIINDGDDYIKVGAIEEDFVDTTLVGYKLMLEINNIFSVELEDGSRQQTLFDFNIVVEDSTFNLTNRFEVNDRVITTASIKMSETDTASEKSLYAANYTTSGVTWHAGKQSTTQINPSDMMFVFTGLNGEVIDEKPYINFTSKTDGFNYAGLVGIDSEDKLFVNNVPYKTTGVAVQITLSYSGDSAMNSRYIFKDGVCTLTTYEDAVDTYRLNIYGFNIKYEPKPIGNVSGEVNKTVNLLTNADYEIRSGKGDTTKLTSISLDKLVTFNYAESDDFVLEGTTLKVKNSLTKQVVVNVALTIGSNNFKTHSITFISPYNVVVTNNKIEAPASAIDLKSYLRVEGGSASTSLTYTFVDTELETGDMVSDFVSISDSKITILNVPIDFDIEIKVQIFDPTDKGVFTGNFIRIINKYNSPDRTDTTTQYVKIGDNNTVLAGSVSTTDINLQSSLTIGKTVTNVTVTFDQNAQAFMRVKDEAIVTANRSIRSLHLSEDTPIVVTVTIYFEGAGYTRVDVQATVLQNFFIEFITPSLSYGMSGQQLNDFDNFNIEDKEGRDLVEGGLQLDNFSYSLNAEAQEYLVIETNASNETVLKVKKDVEQTTVLYVTISYDVMEGAVVAYTIDFQVPITITRAAA